jgi:hypothetical protein
VQDLIEAPFDTRMRRGLPHGLPQSFEGRTPQPRRLTPNRSVYHAGPSRTLQSERPTARLRFSPPVC